MGKHNKADHASLAWLGLKIFRGHFSDKAILFFGQSYVILNFNTFFLL